MRPLIAVSVVGATAMLFGTYVACRFLHYRLCRAKGARK